MLKTYFSKNNIDYNEIFARIEDVIIKTILSIESSLFSAVTVQVPYQHNCFDLFGFDILLDSKLKPWLLEVNLNPSLACESPLDFNIKRELMADLFSLVGIVPISQRAHIEPQQFGKSYVIYNHPHGITLFDRRNRVEEKSLDELNKDEKEIIRITNEEWERYKLYLAEN